MANSQFCFNGEIYNYRELRRGLEREGHVFRTHCDTEIHLHLYRRYGPEYRAAAPRGMFAVAIWDGEARSAPCWRAIGMGSSRSTTATPAVSSRPRPSCARSRGARSTSTRSRRSCTFNSVPAPYSIFRETRKLPAGHVLVWSERAS